MSARPEEQRWLLVQLKPNGLKMARANLERQGLATFMPMRLQTRPAGRRYLTRPEPLFPGYLFVEAAAGDAGGAIRNTRGVARVVSFGDAFARVPGGLIRRLRRLCDGERLVAGAQALRAGEPVRIEAGPFAALIAKVERVDPDRRIWGLIDLLGKATRVKLRAVDVSAIR